MDGQATGGIVRFFHDLPDPRAHNVIHKLHDILVIAICAVICGAGGWAEVEVFGNSKLAWFKTFWTCPAASPATTRSAGCSRTWTPTRSSGASWPGPVRSRRRRAASG